ncbi:zinc-binding protein A33-like [Rhinoraja longicauda]
MLKTGIKAGQHCNITQRCSLLSRELRYREKSLGKLPAGAEESSGEDPAAVWTGPVVEGEEGAAGRGWTSAVEDRPAEGAMRSTGSCARRRVERWDREERNSCPECREEFEERTLRVSRALARLAEKARKLSLNRTKGSKLHCEKHQEELKLFCETHKKLICVVCAAAREHTSHSFMLIEEAVEIYKGQVKSTFESLRNKESEIWRTEEEQKESFSEVQEESHKLQSQITSQFAELHQILTEKEQCLLGEIREEEKTIVKTMQKNLQEIQENLKSIQEELSKLQEQIDHKDGVIFLKEVAGRKTW